MGSVRLGARRRVLDEQPVVAVLRADLGDVVPGGVECLLVLVTTVGGVVEIDGLRDPRVRTGEPDGTSRSQRLDISLSGSSDTGKADGHCHDDGAEDSADLALHVLPF